MGDTFRKRLHCFQKNLYTKTTDCFAYICRNSTNSIDTTQYFSYNYYRC